jgi:NifB/MoaA-like Fe-S oxidoreductase
MQAAHDGRVCYAADEFYLAAGQPIPDAGYYGDFDQLENGVGLLALLMDEFASALENEEPTATQRSVALATGVGAAPFLREMAEQACQAFTGLDAQVFPIVNDFFGHDITVAGLVTGGDIVRQLEQPERFQELLIPSVMLRHEGDLFLDGMSLDELTEQLGIPVRVVANDGFELLDAMLNRLQ